MEAVDGAIDLVIEAPRRDLGGFAVRRALPSMRRRALGPFVFFDHMGPVHLPPGQGMDVRPHPHIGLATVTYLFRGEIDHRDSVGSVQTIRPGDVNWMLAGRGIVHSERTGAAARHAGPDVHGIQSWIGLPTAHEEDAPWFAHHPSATIPHVAVGGMALDVIAGTAYGRVSPVRVVSPTLYVHALLDPGSRHVVDDTHPNRGVYVVEGTVRCGDTVLTEGHMAVLRPGARAEIHTAEGARVMLVGGAPLDGERHIVWNFVSSSRERIARAEDDWAARRFPVVPGDEVEFIPLPTRPA